MHVPEDGKPSPVPSASAERPSSAKDSPKNPKNAFDADVLERMHARSDEPATVGEALSSGPPRIVLHDDGRVDVFLGQDSGTAEPFASSDELPVALLLATAFPLLQRSRTYYRSEEDRHRIHRDGRPVARVRYCDEEVVETLNLFDALVRSPEALTNVLVASGAGVVEVVGRLLAERFPS